MKSHTVSYFLFSPSNVFNFLMFIHLAIECSLWGTSNCCLPSSPPPQSPLWWEWKPMFQSLQTGRGGRTGVVSWKGGRECVWICVEGCWQQEPCWDSSLLQPLNIQKPSHQPHCYYHGPLTTDWLNSCPEYIDLYVSVCVWVCMCFLWQSTASGVWALTLESEMTQERVYTVRESIAAKASVCFLSEDKMIDACVCGGIYFVCVHLCSSWSEMMDWGLVEDRCVLMTCVSFLTGCHIKMFHIFCVLLRLGVYVSKNAAQLM